MANPSPIEVVEVCESYVDLEGENKPPWLFWVFVAGGFAIGALMTTLVFRTKKKTVEERMKKIK